MILMYNSCTDTLNGKNIFWIKPNDYVLKNDFFSIKEK